MNQAILTYGIPFLITMDIFFLSISGGVTLQPYNWVKTLKASAVFAFSQLLAAGLGIGISVLILPLIIDFSDIAAALLIGFFAFKMAQEAVKVKNEQRTFLIEDNDIILPLALASSLNTFVFFVGLGLLNIPYQESITALIISTLALSQLGLFIGSHYRPERIGRSSKLLAGISIILLLILFFVL
ncbi:MAG: manganese efflux pump [Bacteroidales bacterium]|nr:manganese efflux pump [Bacteroidales bacterium]